MSQSKRKEKIIIIGPSYIGKTFFINRYFADKPEFNILTFAEYKVPLRFVIFHIFKHLISWSIFLIKITQTEGIEKFVKFRIWKYSFKTYSILNNKSKKTSVIDEDLLKKIMDGVPIPNNINSYKNLYTLYIRNLDIFVKYYFNLRELKNSTIVILDNSYKQVLINSKNRRELENVYNNDRDFRNRFTLERRIYCHLSKRISEQNIEVLKLDLSRLSNKYIEDFLLNRSS